MKDQIKKDRNSKYSKEFQKEPGESKEIEKSSAGTGTLPPKEMQPVVDIEKVTDLNKDQKVPNNTPVTKVVAAPKQIFNTKKASELLKGQLAGSGIPTGMASAAVSGAGEVVAGDFAQLSVQDEAARSDTRVGKRLDTSVRLVNTMITEQTRVNVKRSVPLGQTNSTQGFNGRYYKEQRLNTKQLGGHPMEDYFDRSIDMISYDYML